MRTDGIEKVQRRLWQGGRWLLAGGLLLLAAGPALAQAPRILPRDTLLAQLARPHLPDTTRVLHLLHLCGYFMSSELPRAQQYGRQAVALAHRIGYLRGEAMALGNLAGAYYNGDDFRQAEQLFEQGLLVARRARLPEQTGHAYLGLGNVTQALGNVPQALTYFEQARRAYAASTGPTRRVGQLMVLLNSARAYTDLRQPAAAGRRLRQALALTDSTAPPRLVASVLTELADVQVRAGAPDSAQALLRQALALATRYRLPKNEADARVLLANIALARHQPQQARQQALQALQLSQRTGIVFTQHNALHSLADALHALRRPEAYDTLARYLVLHDTLASQDQADAVLTTSARFNNREQQAEIRNLQQARRLTAQTQELKTLRYRQRLVGLGGLGLLALALGGGLLWRYRHRQAAQEEILRNRLAADLHDDVGTLLSQISMQSDILQEGLADAAGQRRQLGQISEASRAAMRQLNDVVWSLDAHNDHLPNLLDRMRDYAHELLPPAGIGVTVTTPLDLPVRRLPVLLRRNLYLIYKEALHNVLKHAPQARTVAVVLALEEGKWLVLQVDDDAFPATPAAAGHAARRSGHGLRNIAQRAEACGGTAECGRVFSGFRVRVRVPLAAG